MAWGRLALIQAAGEQTQVLDKIAAGFDYQLIADDSNEQTDSEQQQTELTGKSQPLITDSEYLAAKKTARKQRPPAKFIRVNRITELDQTEHTRPAHLDKPELCLQADQSPAGTYHFAKPDPLLSISSLLPFLHNSLGQLRQVNRLDYRRITRHVVNLKPITHLPCLSRQRWPQRLLVIVDVSTALEPYWSDFAYIIQQLQSLLGKEAVKAIRLDEETLGSNRSAYITWPTEDHHQWLRWSTPAANQAILLLSDLGVSDSQGIRRIQWQNLLKQLHNHTAPILTLSPASQTPDNPTLCRQARVNPLVDSIKLPAYPGNKTYQLEAITADKMQEIFALLSPLPLIDSGLLRRLRTELQWGSSHLESIIWNHKVISVTSLGIRLDAAYAEQYRQYYQQHLQGTKQAQKMWQIVESHHSKAFEGLRQLEKLNQCVLEDIDSQETRDYFNRLTTTLTQTDSNSAQHAALLMQCRTILVSRSKRIWQTDMADLAYNLYAMVYGEDIQKGQWPELEPGFDRNRLGWLLEKQHTQQRQAWQLVQTGGQGELTLTQQHSQEKPEQAHDTLAALLSFESLKEIPPVWQYASAEGNLFQATDHQTIGLSTGVLHLTSSLQKIELEAMTKPSWASSISYNAEGLYATVDWLGAQYVLIWQAGKGIAKGRWLCPDPLAIDQYGLSVVLKINKVSQRFRWIEPGEFLMGSPETELERNDNEAQHHVTLTQGYWLADTACTQDFWQVVMNDNPARFKNNKENPVEQVSWGDVQNFIKTLNQLIPDLNACLPTEAQWEYACRAGTLSPFSFGDNITTKQVNYDGEYPYADGEIGECRNKTVPVGFLSGNAWDLYEMHGNVWEWCDDWYGEYPSESVVDPAGPNNGEIRVLRGGCWLFNGWRTRSAYRYGNTPDGSSRNIGFRLALGQTGSSKEKIDSDGYRRGQASGSADGQRRKQERMIEKVIKQAKKLISSKNKGK